MRWTVESCLFLRRGLPWPVGEPGSGPPYSEFGHGRAFLQVEVHVARAVGTLGGCTELGEGVGARLRQDSDLGGDGPLLPVRPSVGTVPSRVRSRSRPPTRVRRVRHGAGSSRPGPSGAWSPGCRWPSGR